jgi:RHS repeat-associated protein
MKTFKRTWENRRRIIVFKYKAKLFVIALLMGSILGIDFLETFAEHNTASANVALQVPFGMHHRTQPVGFNISVSPASDPECQADQFTINFGDGSSMQGTSAGPLVIQHVYQNIGSYPVVLDYQTFKNHGGSVPDCRLGRSSSNLQVEIDYLPFLLLGVSANPETGPAPLEVVLQGAASTDPLCLPLNSEWNFGDGQSLQQGGPILHTYQNPGQYIATLTIVDSCGRQGSLDTQTIVVTKNIAPFNDFITSNLQIDPEIKPACNCAEVGGILHNSGIAQVPIGCNKCQTVGNFGGIGADAGPNSVLLHSGEYVHNFTHLSIPGLGFDWSFSHKYRAGVTFEGPLGHNWEFNYNRRLVEVTEANLARVQGTFSNAKLGDVIRMDGMSRGDLYSLINPGQWNAPTGFYTQLSQTESGYVERDQKGAVVEYTAVAPNEAVHMTSLSDRNGNTMRFEYNADGQQIRVLDTYGRPIEYSYDERGYLTQVEDFIGRMITLAYDQNGDLISVTSPSVTGTPNGNDFPNGKTIEFSYSSGFEDERFNHNLLTITAPNEVANGGSPRFVLTYNTDPTSPSADRVLTQTIGGTNASGFSAGGTISYEYDGNTTSVTDRNGNLTEYLFNDLGNILSIREFTNRNIRSTDPEFFETLYEYNSNGEMTKMISPEGNFVEYVYDEGNPNPLQRGNLVRVINTADADRGGDQAQIESTISYEPIYNQVRTSTEARGNDSSYSPQNGGSTSAERYTTTFVYDYQEGENFAAIASLIGVPESEVRTRLAGVPMNLGDLNEDGLVNQVVGNIVQIVSPSPTLLNDSKQAAIEGSMSQQIVEKMTYNAAGLMTRSVDPEGNVFINQFFAANDPDGDGQNLIAGVGSSPFGYLSRTIADAEDRSSRNSGTNPAPASITTSYNYDDVGNITQIVDGRGIASEFFINELNQLVQVSSASDVSAALGNSEEPDWSACHDASLVECSAGMVAFGYTTNHAYDANNNLITTEVENSDGNNGALAGSFVEITYSYDILDNEIEMTEDVSEGEVLTSRNYYDKNQNLVLVQTPMSVNGDQPSNLFSYVVDERDLLFTSTRGGTTAQFDSLDANNSIGLSVRDSNDISTMTSFVDRNRNVTKVLDAIDNSADGQLDETIAIFDGFDRLVSVIDSVGNQSFDNYDPAGNTIRTSLYGPLSGSTPQNNNGATTAQPLTESSFSQPLLSRSEALYDELGRVFESRSHLFDYDTVDYQRTPELIDGPLGGSNDGFVVARAEYDQNSRITFVVEDDRNTFQNFYDGLGRSIRSIDPEGNEVLRTFDANHNLSSVTEIDVTAASAVAAGKVPDLAENFTSTYVYDALDRLIRLTDNIGQTSRFHYDSRSNLVFSSDAQHSDNSNNLVADPLGVFSSNINLPGNTSEAFFDGINRLISVVTQLRIDGQGVNEIDTSNSANADGLVVIDYQYDANSRLIAMADDGSLPEDQNSSIGLIETNNPRGNVTRYIYDDLNRQVETHFDDGTTQQLVFDLDDNVLRVIDLNGTITDNFFDGLNRVVRSSVNPSNSAIPHPAGGFKDPTIEWEIVGTTEQTFEYDGLSRIVSSTDNNNSDDSADVAVITNSYDSLSRLLEQTQSGSIVSYRWDGQSKRLGLIYPNGRSLSFGFDQLDRINTIGDTTTSNIADYNYIGRGRILERVLSNGVSLSYLNTARTQDIGYDSLRRVVNHSHFSGDESLVAGFEYDYNRSNYFMSETKVHLDNNVEAYTYDSLYRLNEFDREGEDADTYQFDGANNWVNRNGEENTATNMNEYSSFNGMPQLYDDNGNLLDDGKRIYTYDAGNRLRSVSGKSDGSLIAIYNYDALGRRIAKSVSNSGDLDGITEFLYDGWQVIEEIQDGMTQQYVYGLGIDEPLTLDRDFGSDGSIDESFFYHQDGKGYVSALTNESGEMVEEITYDAFGKPSILQSEVGNTYLFNGRRYESEVDLYYNRARFYNAEQGRFIQRDPIGNFGDTPNLGNAYGYVGNSPTSFSDPSGAMREIITLHIGQAGVAMSEEYHVNQVTKGKAPEITARKYWRARYKFRVAVAKAAMGGSPEICPVARFGDKTPDWDLNGADSPDGRDRILLVVGENSPTSSNAHIRVIVVTAGAPPSSHRPSNRPNKQITNIKYEDFGPSLSGGVDWEFEWGLTMGGGGSEGRSGTTLGDVVIVRSPRASSAGSAQLFLFTDADASGARAKRGDTLRITVYNGFRSQSTSAHGKFEPDQYTKSYGFLGGVVAPTPLEAVLHHFRKAYD